MGMLKCLNIYIYICRLLEDLIRLVFAERPFALVRGLSNAAVPLQIRIPTNNSEADCVFWCRGPGCCFFWARGLFVMEWRELTLLFVLQAAKYTKQI